MHPARPVRVQDGMLHVEGEPPRRIDQLNRERQVEENDQGLPRSKSRCGRCLQPGHRATTCPQPTPTR